MLVEYLGMREIKLTKVKKTSEKQISSKQIQIQLSSTWKFLFRMN